MTRQSKTGGLQETSPRVTLSHQEVGRLVAEARWGHRKSEDQQEIGATYRAREPSPWVDEGDLEDYVYRDELEESENDEKGNFFQSFIQNGRKKEQRKGYARKPCLHYD